MSLLDTAIAERRNPIGWIVFGLLVTFMVTSQLTNYETRTPSINLLRSEIESQLEQVVSLKQVGGIPAAATTSRLESAANQLAPKLVGDSETTLLYSAIRTEEGKALTPAELGAIKLATKEPYKAAFQIYSPGRLTSVEAKALAARVPETSFLYRLVRSHALEKGNVPGAEAGVADSQSVLLKTLATALLGLLIVGGCALVFGYVVARASGKLTPLGFAVGDITAADADRLALRAAQILGLFLVVAVIGALTFGRVAKDFLEIPVYLATMGFTVLAFRGPIAGKIVSLKSIGLSTERWKEHVLWGVGAAIANLPIIFGVSLVTSKLLSNLPQAEHPATVELVGATSIWLVLKLVFAASVGAPFVEEIVFRGTLFPALGKVLNSPIGAGILSSVIFAAIHPTGIPAWPGLACIGGMSCFLAYQTKSLVPSMVMHAVHNFGTLVMTLLIYR